MHKRLKILINNVKEIFSIQFLDRLSKKTGFVKRKSKLDAKTFLAFNTFLSDDLCDKSLSTLCGRLAAQYNISISPQALNKRFKNPTPTFRKNGRIVKSTEYIKIDILEIIKPLADGETIEIKDIYIGSKKELKNYSLLSSYNNCSRTIICIKYSFR